MVIQLQLISLALAGRALLSSNRSYPSAHRSRALPAPCSGALKIKKELSRGLLNVQNTLHGMLNGLSSSIYRMTQPPPKEDYNAIVKNFIPADVELLSPHNSVHKEKIQFADLDGDLQDELITSYRLNNEIVTVILKKQNGIWDKISEIRNPGLDSLDFASSADITGEGKKQLLLAWKTNDGRGELHGYSLQNGEANKLFTQNYSRLEILEPQQNNRIDSNARLAVWNTHDVSEYNIEVFQWNGSGLEPIKNQTSYFYKRVLPYYGMKTRQMPRDPYNWYCLAHALAKSKMYSDAISAIEFGVRLNPVSPSLEEFMNLKEKIIEQM